MHSGRGVSWAGWAKPQGVLRRTATHNTGRRLGNPWARLVSWAELKLGGAGVGALPVTHNTSSFPPSHNALHPSFYFAAKNSTSLLYKVQQLYFYCTDAVSVEIRKISCDSADYRPSRICPVVVKNLDIWIFWISPDFIEQQQENSFCCSFSSQILVSLCCTSFD